MFTRIHSATVVVKDQDTALDFFVNKLGWEKCADQQVMENMRWLTVKPVGAQTELALMAESAMGDAGCGAVGVNTGLSLVVKDIDAAYETLTGRGVRFKGPVETMPWGMKATWFYDRDGNEYFLVGE